MNQAAPFEPVARPPADRPRRAKPLRANSLLIVRADPSRLLARATRRVEAGLRVLSGPSSRLAMTLDLLALAALHADATWLDELKPRPPARLMLQLIDRLEDEVLALGRLGMARQALDAVRRLRVVRAAVEQRQDGPDNPLAGFDGPEFLIEFVHDLRSPLSSLQLLAGRLQQGQSGPLTPLQQRQLRLIYAATHALSNVTSNALQLTRRRDQLEEPEARPFSVTRLLSEVQELVRTLALQKGLEVSYIRPDGDRRLGHPIELQRILLNLVTNAVKFTRTGGVTVRATDLADARMEFAVEDTGPGIDEAVQDSLFQPFRNCDGRAVFSATRLGLAISQKLVHALGGQLQYQTSVGKGTRFSFVVELPIP